MVRSSFEHSQEIEKEVLTRTLAFQGVHDVLGSMGYFARRATSIGAALGACSVLQSLSPWRVAFRVRGVAVERSRRVAVWRLALGDPLRWADLALGNVSTQLFSCRRNRTRMHALCVAWSSATVGLSLNLNPMQKVLNSTPPDPRARADRREQRERPECRSADGIEFDSYGLVDSERKPVKRVVVASCS